METNYADQKAAWYAWTTVCHSAVGVHILQWAPMEWADIYVLWRG